MRLSDLPPSPAQLRTNRANAALSTGPKTPAGKAAVARNACRHGLTGAFMVLAWENQEEFDQLVRDLNAEHQPATPTEKILVDRLAQHHWLRERALALQGTCFHSQEPLCENGDQAQLALFLRYQTTHERAFSKCLRELIALRAGRRKSEETEKKAALGFVSQKAREARLAAQEKRAAAAEIRREQLHELRMSANQRPHKPEPRPLPAAA